MKPVPAGTATHVLPRTHADKQRETRVTFLSYRSLEHLNLVDSCYRGALEGQSCWVFTSAQLWHQDVVLSSQRKLSPLVKDRNPWLPKMVHVSPPVDQQFLASLLATDKQGRGQKKDTSCLVWTPDRPDPWPSWQKSPAFPRSPAFTDTHTCAHPAVDLTGQHSHGHSRETKTGQQSLCPPNVVLQPSAAGFLPPFPRAGPGLCACGSGLLGQ